MPHPDIVMSLIQTGLVVAFLLCASGFVASAAGPAPVPVASDPVATTAAYGDWVLRCQRVNDKSQACEVAQTIQVKDKDRTVPVAQITFSRAKSGEPLRIMVVLPTNIVLPSSAALALSEKDARPIELPWRRCIPGGCVAEVQPPADALKAYLTAAEPGRLTFTDATGRPMVLPLSLRGLQQAIEALNRT